MVKKNRFTSLVLLVCLLICNNLWAQKPAPDTLLKFEYQQLCSSDLLLEKMRQQKDYKTREDKMNREILSGARPKANDTLTLPVVIHIINPSPFAVTDAQVIGGINELNEAFSKSGTYAASLGADAKIKFCIAKKDPDGGITTGITRTTSFFGMDLNMDNEDDKLKNLIQWDPARYINIWFINNIYAEMYASYSCGRWSRMGVGGYATMPPGGSTLDGIVITGFGKLLIHEMGHYLGLYHTFEGGCYNNDCTINGDRVCDTPPDGSLGASANCNSPSNTCNTDTLSNYSNGFFTTDVPDPISNFMDYSNAPCSNEFTQGQADRMRAAVLTQRSGLLQDQCSPPCSENIVAAFLRDTAYTSQGETVTFTNTSTGATNYSWLVNNVATATSTDFSYNFTAPGKYKITLNAFNADANCFSAATTYVIVNCGITARFYFDKKAIASKLPLYPDSIRFTNSSFRGNAFKWLIGNNAGMTEQVVGTDKDLTYTFPTPANYTIRLIATDGTCVDTSGFFRVTAQDPTADAAVIFSNVYCFQQTKVKVNFCVDNYGFAPLPAGTPVTFYDSDPRLPGANQLQPTFYLPYETKGGYCRYCFYDHTLNIPYAGLNQLYAVINDSGNTKPLVLPNRTFPEKNYANNVAFINNFRFRVTATPAISTLLPGDTLKLLAQAFPANFPSATYLWSEAYKLSCTACSQPDLYADSDRVKRVIASSQFGCKDTTYLTIKVPPANDYTVRLNQVICSSQDSMMVDFSLVNGFFRGVLPKNLKVSFYNGNPNAPGAVLLPPIYSIKDTIFGLKANFATRIKLMPEGTLYAVVNDSSVSLPVVLPNTLKLEKIYTNNADSIAYVPNKTFIDTSICEGFAYFGYKLTGTYIDTLRGYNGCDSIRTVRLVMRPIFKTTITTAICQGENYAGHTSTGTYVDVYTAINGCDSTRTLFLKVKPVFVTSVTKIICQDETYAGYGSSGIYVDKFAAINGCDSTRTLTLTVNPKKYLTINPEICEGESWLAGGKLQTTTGVYFDSMKTYLDCDSVKTTRLTVHPKPKPILGGDRGICMGSTYTLNPGIFDRYLWQDGSTNNSYTTAVPGKYFVRVTTQYGCIAADTILLDKILPLPANFLPVDSSLCNGNILTLQAPGYKTYLWSTGSSDRQINITKNGTYKLQVTDRFDCAGADSMKVFFFTDCIIVGIPNAFSPNGDGLNETFKPYFTAPVTNYSMQLFNRLGQLVFETKNPVAGWDGRYKGSGQDPATYVYYITFKDFRGEPVSKRGTVILIR